MVVLSFGETARTEATGDVSARDALADAEAKGKAHAPVDVGADVDAEVEAETTAPAARGFERLLAAASAILSERSLAAERVRRLAADIAAREEAQVEATNADDFDAAEALELPLRRSRDELKACEGRLEAAEGAVRAFEAELLEASQAVVAELDASSGALVTRRAEGLGELRSMRADALGEAARAAERSAVERERLSLDASRLAEDDAQLRKASRGVEAEVAASESAAENGGVGDGEETPVGWGAEGDAPALSFGEDATSSPVVPPSTEVDAKGGTGEAVWDPVHDLPRSFPNASEREAASLAW